MNMKKSLRSTWYIKWYYVLILSLGLALYLNWPTQFIRIMDLVHMQIFWKALIFSWFLGFVLIWLIGFISKRLDRIYPWKKNLLQRLGRQLLLGVILPLFVILLLVRYGYFKDQESFRKSGYLVLEFPVVVAGIMTLNFLYYSFSRQSKQHKLQLKSLVRGKFRLVSAEEIVMIRRHKKVGFALLKDGKEGRIDYLIEDLEQLLDPQKFFTINRSTIIALECIKGWVPVRNGQFLLELCCEVPEGTKLIVSRSRKRTLETLLTGQLQPADD